MATGEPGVPTLIEALPDPPICALLVVHDVPLPAVMYEIAVLPVMPDHHKGC
jgi:hypothetical protein